MKATTYDVGEEIGLRIDKIKDMVEKGKRNPKIRELSMKVLGRKCNGKPGAGWCIPEKAWRAECEAIFDFVRSKVRYTRDIAGVDTYQAAHRTLQMEGGDCFPEGTLLLADDYSFIRVEDVRPGMKIWGFDRWSVVEDACSKGTLSLDAILLGNGASFRLTSGHKVYVVREENGLRSQSRITVGELKRGDLLLRPRTSKATREDDLALVYRVDGKPARLTEVRSIERNVASAPCYDISTDDHYVYLPEHDVTVSNCDCISILLASMLQSVGYPVKLHVMQTKGSDSWSHILIKVGLPPQAPTAWLPLDGSVDQAAGWYPPKDIVVKTKDFLLDGMG